MHDPSYTYVYFVFIQLLLSKIRIYTIVNSYILKYADTL